MKQSVWKSQHENDGLGKYGGRDLVGFGEKTPSPKWPSNAKVAVNFVINYEEGGESCILHGDTKSESLLSDIVGAVSYGTLSIAPGRRNNFLRSVICLTPLPLLHRGRAPSQHGKLVRLWISFGFLEAASPIHVPKSAVHRLCRGNGT
jgi:hypothetical protein